MMNGALTIGTLDGANIEITEEVGEDHIFIFGLRAPEVAALKSAGYRPSEWLDRVPGLRESIELISEDHFSRAEPGLFRPLVDYLLGSDPYMVLADFGDYLLAQQDAEARFLDRKSWTRSSIINVAHSGRFSSDRSITDYARDIWRAPCRGLGKPRSAR